MNKSITFILEFLGLIGTIMSMVGLFQSAAEIVYRREPIFSSMLINEHTLAMFKNDTDKDLQEQLLTIDVNSFIYNDPESVLNELTQILREHPDYFRGYYDRGLIHLSAGRIDAGVEDLQVVIQQSEDVNLRQQASREISLARIAPVLAPIPFLGLAGVAILFIANLAGVKLQPSSRTIKVFIAAFVLWVASFTFLLLH